MFSSYTVSLGLRSYRLCVFHEIYFIFSCLPNICTRTECKVMRTVSFLGFTTSIGEMVFRMPLKYISNYMKNGYTDVIQKRATEGKA